MESFSLLKYWRGAGGTTTADSPLPKPRAALTPSETTTIVTTVTENDQACHEDEDEDDFFDLELTLRQEEDEEEVDKKKVEVESGSENDGEVESDREFKFIFSSGSSIDRADQNLPLSPSDADDLVVKEVLVPIEQVAETEVSNGKLPAQFPVSILKSATKLRVFMSGLKKSKANNQTKPEAQSCIGERKKQGGGGDSFTVKLKVEEVVPVVSLFTRDNSSRTSVTTVKKQTGEETVLSSDEKRFAMQKYLNKVKPLYVRVSSKYAGEKAKFSSQFRGCTAPETVQSESANPVKSQKQQGNTNIPAGLKVVRKRLGKSKSGSLAAVAAVPTAVVVPRRRDDSLLQQQDGIQSAIMHCKRSFNSSRESESGTTLSRSISDSSHENSKKKSSDEYEEAG